MIWIQLSILFVAAGMLLTAYMIMRLSNSMVILWRQHDADMKMLKIWIDEHLAAHVVHGENQLKLLRLLQSIKEPINDDE